MMTHTHRLTQHRTDLAIFHFNAIAFNCNLAIEYLAKAIRTGFIYRPWSLSLSGHKSNRNDNRNCEKKILKYNIITFRITNIHMENVWVVNA